MSSIDNFLSEVYSEEIYSIDEREFDEVMRLAAQDDESEWAGYDEWSEQVEAENFHIVDGRVLHKPQPKSNGRIGAIEI
jgi:hypothetical protein